MPYATELFVERAAGGRDKLIQLTDLEFTGEADLTYLADAVAEADSWINSFLQHRYAVPVPDLDVPEILRRVSAAEAVYILKNRREALTEGDQSRHEERMSWLEGVRRGEISLGTDPRLTESTNVSPATGDRELKDHSLTRNKFDDSGWV
jgi:phage gp36-like protein